MGRIDDTNYRDYVKPEIPEDCACEENCPSAADGECKCENKE